MMENKIISTKNYSWCSGGFAELCIFDPAIVTTYSLCTLSESCMCYSYKGFDTVMVWVAHQVGPPAWIKHSFCLGVMVQLLISNRTCAHDWIYSLRSLDQVTIATITDVRKLQISRPHHASTIACGSTHDKLWISVMRKIESLRCGSIEAT